MNGEYLLKHLMAAFLANVLLLGAILAIRSIPPLTDIKITAQKEGLILSGKTILGLNQVKVFNNWDELDSYLELTNIVLAPINEAHLEHNIYAKSEGLKNKFIYRQAKDESPIWISPDDKTAKVLLTHLRFGNLVSGPYGFSLSASNNWVEKINQLQLPWNE